MTTKKKTNIESYFLTEEHMIIFALVYLDGAIREEILGIKEEYYENLTKAKRWRNKIIKKIHPDTNQHQDANTASAKLNAIYERMAKNAE